MGANRLNIEQIWEFTVVTDVEFPVSEYIIFQTYSVNKLTNSSSDDDLQCTGWSAKAKPAREKRASFDLVREFDEVEVILFGRLQL